MAHTLFLLLGQQTGLTSWEISENAVLVRLVLAYVCLTGDQTVLESTSVGSSLGKTRAE